MVKWQLRDKPFNQGRRWTPKIGQPDSVDKLRARRTYRSKEASGGLSVGKRQTVVNLIRGPVVKSRVTPAVVVVGDPPTEPVS